MDRANPPLTFGEAHARYTPPPGTGMTLRQAEAFVHRYGWLLQREGEQTRDWLASQTDRQAIHFQTNPDRTDWEPVRVFDVKAVARFVNRFGSDTAVAGYVQYPSVGQAPRLVSLAVGWEAERVIVIWEGPIRPPAWGIDRTQRHRWRV